MASRLNMKVMLPVVATLLLIKFALLPVVAWQNELLAELEQHEQRNAKAERLLNGEAQLLAQLAALSQDYDAQEKAYPRFAAAEDFHIETKMMFDILLRQFNLKVTQFFWRDSTDKEIFPGMYKARFNVDFTGKFKDFALLQARLGTTEKAFRIVNFSNAVKQQSATSMGLVNSTLTVEAYYWLGPEGEQ
ncbi:MAG: hypothetical protein ACI8WB_002037 [Phenylobacterium sp.]|jgi:hypothetical protein